MTYKLKYCFQTFDFFYKNHFFSNTKILSWYRYGYLNREWILKPEKRMILRIGFGFNNSLLIMTTTTNFVFSNIEKPICAENLSGISKRLWYWFFHSEIKNMYDICFDLISQFNLSASI